MGSPSFRRDPFARERAYINKINGLHLQKYANPAIDTQREFPRVTKTLLHHEAKPPLELPLSHAGRSQRRVYRFEAIHFQSPKRTL
jgi:hypothetical protein